MEEPFYYVKNFCEERENFFKIAFYELNIYIYPFDKKCDLGRIILQGSPKNVSLYKLWKNLDV